MRGAILSGMMGGLSLLPILTDRQVGPSRFTGGWQQVANRSPLASRSVERLASEPHCGLMSALPPKADIGTQSSNVRFVPIADSCTTAIEGRFTISIAVFCQ